MGDLLVIMVIGLIAYIVVRVSQKQPIIPAQFQFWRNNETTMAAKKGLEDKLAKKSQKIKINNNNMRNKSRIYLKN